MTTFATRPERCPACNANFVNHYTAANFSEYSCSFRLYYQADESWKTSCFEFEQCERAFDSAVSLRAENERLRAALERYGGHKLDCRYTRGQAGFHAAADCNCGYAAALAPAATEGE